MVVDEGCDFCIAGRSTKVVAKHNEFKDLDGVKYDLVDFEVCFICTEPTHKARAEVLWYT